MRSSGGHREEPHTNGQLQTKVVDSVILVCVCNGIICLYVRNYIYRPQKYFNWFQSMNGMSFPL